MPEPNLAQYNAFVPQKPAGNAGVAIFRWGAAALFFASLGYFLYAYAIRFAVPAQGALSVVDLLINVALFTLFAGHHSVLARRPVRSAVARMVPAGAERSLYVAVASVLFFAVNSLWRPLPGIVWNVPPPAGLIFYLAPLIGVILTLRSAAVIDIGDLAGLRDADESAPTEFKTNGPYGWVRHPIYTGWFLFVFGVPLMTTTRLEFALVSCAYIVLAIPLEEGTIRRVAGDQYDRYATVVRWKLFPGIY